MFKVLCLAFILINYVSPMPKKELTNGQAEHNNQNNIQSYWSVSNRITSDVRLFKVDITSENFMTYTEIPEINQQNLRNEKLYILDNGVDIYVWVGEEVSNRLSKLAMDVGKNYAVQRGIYTIPAVVRVIQQGNESSAFKKFFTKWDEKIMMKRNNYSEDKIAAIELNEIDSFE